MAGSYLSKVDELLNLYKEASVRVIKSASPPYECNESAVDSIISPEHRARKSKRLLKVCKRLNEVEPFKNDVISDIDELPAKDECLVDKNEEVIPFLFVKVDEKSSYVQDKFLEIVTHIIPVDPLVEEGTSSSILPNSDNGLNEMNVCKNYKPTKSMPRVIITSLPREKEFGVKVLRKRKVPFNFPVDSTQKVNNSNSPKTLGQNIVRITRVLKDNKTNTKVQQINSKTRSNKERIRTHSSKNRKVSLETHNFSCTKCKKSFQYASALKAHNVSHTGVKSYACDRCPSRYSQKSHLKRHSFTHKKNSKKFKCSVCKKSFSQKYYLQVHMNVHSGAKPYTCDECSKSFSQKSHLNTHAKTHKEKEFYCDLCSKSFTLFHQLSYHIKNVHKYREF